MAQPHNVHGSSDENFLHYITENLMMQPDSSFKRMEQVPSSSLRQIELRDI
jgi:hypothetical protein